MKNKVSLQTTRYHFPTVNCLLLIANCLLPIALFAQIDNAQKYASDITRSDFKKHLSIIASAQMEGRETAMPGQKKAAAYIESQFKQIGLKHPSQLIGYQQSYPLFKDTLLSSSLEISKKKYVFSKDYFLIPGNLLKQNIKTKELIFVGYGIDDKNYDDYGAKDVKGKIVVFFIGEPKVNSRSLSTGLGRNAQWSTDKKVILAKQKGAAAAIVINPSMDTISRMILENPRRTNIYFPRPVTRETDKVTYAAVVNRVATNIFGESVFIEMAQAFAKAKAEGHGPRRTVVFMTVSGEEKGLWGSEYYTDHPLFPLEKTTVDLNTDMVGRIDPDRKVGDSTNYVYVVGDDKLSSDLKPISISINKKYVNLELDYKYNDPNDRERIYYRSDHYNFARKGVPIIFYYDGMLRPDYHRPTDTVDKINFNLMEKRVRLIFLTAWEMANRENMLKRDISLPAL